MGGQWDRGDYLKGFGNGKTSVNGYMAASLNTSSNEKQ